MIHRTLSQTEDFRFWSEMRRIFEWRKNSIFHGETKFLKDRGSNPPHPENEKGFSYSPWRPFFFAATRFDFSGNALAALEEKTLRIGRLLADPVNWNWMGNGGLENGRLKGEGRRDARNLLSARWSRETAGEEMRSWLSPLRSKIGNSN